MPVHIGKKIREEIDRQRINITEFAEKINRSRNDVYDIFKRESVDTALLTQIGLILGCDFFSFLSSQKEYLKRDMKNFYQIEEPDGGFTVMSRENFLKLQKDNENLKKEVEHFKKYISLLEAKNPRQKNK